MASKTPKKPGRPAKRVRKFAAGGSTEKDQLKNVPTVYGPPQDEGVRAMMNAARNQAQQSVSAMAGPQLRPPAVPVPNYQAPPPRPAPTPNFGAFQDRLSGDVRDAYGRAMAGVTSGQAPNVGVRGPDWNKLADNGAAAVDAVRQGVGTAAQRVGGAAAELGSSLATGARLAGRETTQAAQAALGHLNDFTGRLQSEGRRDVAQAIANRGGQDVSFEGNKADVLSAIRNSPVARGAAALWDPQRLGDRLSENRPNSWADVRAAVTRAPSAPPQIPGISAAAAAEPPANDPRNQALVDKLRQAPPAPANDPRNQALIGKLRQAPPAPVPTPAPTNSPQQPPAVPANADAMAAWENSALRRGKVPTGPLTKSDEQYIAQLKAAGGDVLYGPRGEFRGYQMPSGPVSAADLGRQVAQTGGPNYDAFSPENIAKVTAPGYKTSGDGMSSGALGGDTQGELDNRLLRAWYAMSPSQRGSAPTGVLEAQHRGGNPQETAMNVARSRIMSAGLDPVQQSMALANLEKIRGMLDNYAAQGRRWDAQSANEQRGTELQGQHWGNQDANERFANEDTAGYRQGMLGNTAAEMALNAANRNQTAQLERDKFEEGWKQANPIVNPLPAFDEKIQYGTPEYKRQSENYVRMLQARMALQALQAANPNATQEQLAELASQPLPNGKPNPAGLAINRENLNRWRERYKKYAGGGMVTAGVNPLVQQFQNYVANARAAGAPPVSFQQFVELTAGALREAPQPGALGMAGGGSVPVAGKMVVDTNPQAPTDSIPAQIDGKNPAALNSGEFVIPTDVVRFYGTKFFDGLLQKARQNGQS